MSRVSLDLDGGERPAGPEACLQSIRMSRGAVELAAELTGVLLPWQEAPTPQRSGLEAALGPVAPPTETPRPDTAVATRELREAGLLSAATEVPRVASPLQGLLALLACGAVRVDADLVVHRRRAARGAVRLRSWHRRHHDRFAAVSTADGHEVEVTWGAVAAWPGVLTRLATLTPEPVPGETRPPAARVELPWDLLLASGRAVRERRDDLLHALVDSAGEAVLIADDPPGPTRAASDAEATEQLRLLHRASCGRLQATVGGIGRTGRPVLGMVTWSLFPDGWRSLVPVPGEGARVLVRACSPERFAAEVVAHVAGVRP